MDNPLTALGKQTGPNLNVPQTGTAPAIVPPPMQIAQAAPTLPITPEIAARFRKRLIDADNDEALKKVVRDAAKYGVDWSHMLIGIE